MAVLVTRPDERGLQLVEMLNNVGIAAIHLPLFTFESGREQNDIPLELSKLNPRDYVFAVSRNAVAYADSALKNSGIGWRTDIDYFTVGGKTAEFFSSVTLQPTHYPIGEETSEGLLAMEFMQQLSGKNILVLRGNGGRAFFSEQAALRNANVKCIECYQRIPIQYDNDKINLYQRSGVNSIVVTSLESLNYLMYFVFEPVNAWLKNCKLITVSNRIAKVAERHGWSNIVISKKSDNYSLLHTLQSLY